MSCKYIKQFLYKEKKKKKAASCKRNKKTGLKMNGEYISYTTNGGKQKLPCKCDKYSGDNYPIRLRMTVQF